MSYSKPERISYELGSMLTTNSDRVVATIKGPANKSGRIADVIGRVHTAAHVLGSTTVTELHVGHGSAADLKAMADWAVPAGATGAVLSASATAGALKPGFRLPAGTDIVVSHIENDGGSAAGSLNYTLVIDWF